MVDVRFELTTNDPWSVDDAICEGISPLGYWQEVNQSPTQTKPYNDAEILRVLKVRAVHDPQILQVQTVFIPEYRTPKYFEYKKSNPQH